MSTQRCLSGCLLGCFHPEVGLLPWREDRQEIREDAINRDQVLDASINNASTLPGLEEESQPLTRSAEAVNRRLHQLEADLARMNRVSMMGELTASLAHEINQPIAAAAANAMACGQWLRRETPDIAEASRAASKIARDLGRASDIIERVRSLYRKETAKREPVNVNEIIQDMIVLLRDAANRNSMRSAPTSTWGFR